MTVEGINTNTFSDTADITIGAMLLGSRQRRSVEYKGRFFVVFPQVTNITIIFTEDSMTRNTLIGTELGDELQSSHFHAWTVLHFMQAMYFT